MKEKIKLRAESDEMESKGTVQRFNEANSWFFEKINEIDKPLPKATKSKRDRGPKLIDLLMRKGTKAIQRVFLELYQI
jgi:hypothetical protein